MTGIIASPSIQRIDGLPMVSSMTVAKHFEKRHERVLDSIRKTASECAQEFGEHNFVFSSYTSEQGKDLPCYLLTRDGFSLIVMGFTGKKALQWKVRYIEAFNAMERRLAASSGNSGSAPSWFSEYVDQRGVMPDIDSAWRDLLPFYTRIYGGVCIFLEDFRGWLQSQGERYTVPTLGRALRKRGCTPLRHKMRVWDEDGGSYETTRSVYLLPHPGESLPEPELKPLPEAEVLPVLTARSENLETAIRELLVLEAAMAGADIGAPELAEALKVKIYDIINLIK